MWLYTRAEAETFLSCEVEHVQCFTSEQLKKKKKIFSSLNAIAVKSRAMKTSVDVQIGDYIQRCCSVQEIHTSHDVLQKIDSAGEMMQCSAAIDILFLLDGSYSVGKGSFERSKHYAIKLCEALDVGPDKVRVGVIQFGSSPRLEFALDSYASKEELKKRIKKIPHRCVFSSSHAHTAHVLGCRKCY
ncbi:von Willebrand factor A domain-containing protein 2 [Liparis tanakae]|uniref:von Willebrand factor A domain-containing protein 2 n=1 Tax=Liparis tanakae TaxID=230148 RepID=A0A4Z2EJ00_9TELE|nr:von Willebrand factor A domain-containing protein 2 [Liparis tanakae]